MPMMTLRKLTTRSAAAFLLVSSFSPIVAHADVSATPVATAAATATSAVDFTGAQSAYKAAVDTFATSKQTGADYKNLVTAFTTFQKAYRDQIKAINQTFKDAALAARNDFQTGSATAKTAAAKAKLRSARDSALVSATLARDNAIAAMGTLPTRPEKPAAPVKPVKPVKPAK